MKRKGIAVIMHFLLLLVALGGKASAATPIYHDIPAYQEKNLYETEMVTVSGIAVEMVEDSVVTRLEKSIVFEIFNSTKQQTECEIVSENGCLPELKLIKDHNYIIFAKDSEYFMDNVYAWMNGNTLVDIKEIGDIDNPTYDYPEVKSLCLQKRASQEENPEQDKRVMINLPVKRGEATLYNVKIRLVSAFETVETTSGNRGYLRTTLIEDVPYIVEVEHDEYGVETFPLVVKDKSEYGAGKYTYDFSSCKMVESIQLVNKEDSHKNDTIITSQSGRMTAGGMNFKDFLLIDKKLDVKLDLKEKDYEVLSIVLVNPHRWEIGRFPVGDYKITLNEDANKQINKLYYLENESDLKEITFDRTGQKISFVMDNMSMKPIVVEYKVKKMNLKAPASVKAVLSGGYDDVKVTWKKVTGAAGYYVSMKKPGATSFTNLGTTTKLNYVRKNLVDGAKYTFKIVPYYKNGTAKVKGSYSKTASVYTLKKLAVPKVTKVSSKKVKVSWTNIQGESGYQISRSTKKSGTNIVSTYATTSGKTKQLTAVKGKNYYYKVRAYKTVNGKKIFGPWSNVKAYKLK